MKVYVASSMRNIPAVREAQALLRAAGHTITHDWTAHEDNPHPPGSREWLCALDRFGRNDYRGVELARAVIVLLHPESRDTLVEMGMAIAWGIPVVVVNPEVRPSVFHCFTHTAASVVEAVSLLSTLEER